MENRVVGANLHQDEDLIERSIRPKRFEDYVGQTNVTDNLKVYIQASKMRGEPLDHVLFYGPPGLGKTTLAGIIAEEMGVDLRISSGPAITRAGDLAAILTNLNEGDVLFIDEIHRLNRAVEEVLYSAMEDFALDIVTGKGPGASSIRFELPHFTLVGATTRAGSLSAPLRDRFGIISKFDLYTPEELSEILKRSARILDVETDEESRVMLAERSRGTPRVANRLLKRVRDFAQVLGSGRIDPQTVDSALNALGIDELGLEELDRRILTLIIEQFQGGPVGIDTIAASIGEERVTIEDAYEPFLLQSGMLNRTLKGRMASINAYRHLGIEPPEREEPELEDNADDGEQLTL
ncbi:MAG: Holliday junction branch migration DNA helicase RuvB [Clostridiales bacterium]|nr:Holliday junction branch migration DNA helicase RuvB [Clostridiales bacterium]